MKLNELFDVSVEEDMQWGHPSLAIYVPTEGTFVLYKANEDMREGCETGEIPDDTILGVIDLGWDKDTAIIDRVFAQKGYGPLLYHLANTAEKYIAPNKYDVTPQAKAVWKKFFNSDAKRKPIENSHKEEYMQYAYRVSPMLMNKSKAVLNQGKQVHKMFVNSFDNPNEPETYIWEAAASIATEEMKKIYGE